MLVQFSGCQFADPRLFVENPSVWFNAPITTHLLNEHDRYLKTQFTYKGVPVVATAPLQPFFHPETAYASFLKPEADHVYLFPNNQLLFDVALGNFHHFQTALAALPCHSAPMFVFNKWAVDDVEGALDTGFSFEKKLRIHISRVTNLGRRSDEDQQATFCELMDELLDTGGKTPKP